MFFFFVFFCTVLHDGLIKDKQHVIHQLLIAVVIVISVYLLIFNSCPSFACCDICLKKSKSLIAQSLHANIDLHVEKQRLQAIKDWMMGRLGSVAR